MKTILLTVLLFMLGAGNSCSNKEMQGSAKSLNSDTSATYLTTSNPNANAKTAGNNSNSVQVAILLDTSNSMDGLIDQAKSQLWKMVGELALARDKNGNIPDIEIALYEYGNDGLPPEGGYIRMVSELTTDLDLISEKLFGLKTYGGSEYCGQVISKSADDLTWAASNDVLKVIFIAGNEEYTQGTVNYKDACKKAASKGIIINTIFCGPMEEGINTKWKDGADCADGKYMNIDQNQTVAHIDAPQDAEINRLNEQLNDTYIGYGSSGKMRKEMQMEQDKNASQYGTANAAQRAATKASYNYKNASWDLVDAVDEKAVDLAKMDKDDLPEEMQNLKPDERKAYLEKKAAERKSLQDQISKLNAERLDYIANEQRKMAQESPTNTLDAAIINTIRTQAESKGYLFEKK